MNLFQRQFAPRTAGNKGELTVDGKNESDAESFEIREGTNIDEEALRSTWEHFCGPANVKSVHDLTAAGKIMQERNRHDIK